MSLEEKHNYSDEKVANVAEDVHVSGVEEEHLETTHLGDHGLRRDLPSRVVSMIAIAGTIGTGLFLGSGTALTVGGPVGMFLGYLFVGMGVGTMMMSLGEMSCYAPNVGGFIEMGTRYIDPAFGFMLGINSCLSQAFGIPTELAAIASLFTYWDPNTSHAAGYIVAFMVLTLAVNIIGVKWYGEIEFVFACIKISALVGLMIFGLIVDLGGIPGNKKFIGGKYWREEPFNDNWRGVMPVGLSRFLGFWGVFTKAAFAYSTTECVAVLAGEAHNPRRSMSKAIKTVFYRIVFIYVISVLIIGLTVSQHSPNLLRAVEDGASNAGSSPYVVLCKEVGVKVLPHIVNGVVISSALSSGNEQVYSMSRGLMALARSKQLPRLFLRTSKRGVPWAGVCIAGLCSCLAFLSVSNGSNQAFVWLSNLSALSSLISWMSIGWAYTRFRRAMALQGIDRANLTFKGLGQPYAAWFTVFFFGIILIFNGFGAFIPKFSVSDFFACYVTLLLVGTAFGGWKIFKKTKMVRLEDIDLSGGPVEALRGTKYDSMVSAYHA